MAKQQLAKKELTQKQLNKLVEELFSIGTKIIHPAFPVYLKKESVEFELRRNEWYWTTITEEKGPFKSLSAARDDRTKSAQENMKAQRRGLP